MKSGFAFWVSRLDITAFRTKARQAALKIVHPLKREEHQSRYVFKITPNLDVTSKTL
jgi:hypothetical protein